MRQGFPLEKPHCFTQWIRLTYKLNDFLTNQMVTRPCWVEEDLHSSRQFPVLIVWRSEYYANFHHSLEPSSQPLRGNCVCIWGSRAGVYFAQQGPVALALSSLNKWSLRTWNGAKAGDAEMTGTQCLPSGCSYCSEEASDRNRWFEGLGYCGSTGEGLLAQPETLAKEVLPGWVLRMSRNDQMGQDRKHRPFVKENIEIWRSMLQGENCKQEKC